MKMRSTSEDEKKSNFHVSILNILLAPFKFSRHSDSSHFSLLCMLHSSSLIVKIVPLHEFFMLSSGSEIITRQESFDFGRFVVLMISDVKRDEN